MSLTLTSQDVRALAALQETLLAPLDYATVPDWCRAVLPQLESLFHGDRSAAFVPLDGAVHYVSESIDPQFMKAFQEAMADMQPGALRFADNVTDRAWDARRGRGLEVWSIPLLAQLLGVRMEDAGVYHDVVRPAGLVHSAVASTPLQTGEAFLGVSVSNPSRARFDEPSGLDLMRMVLPAFKAGVLTLVRLQAQRDALARTLDTLGHALLVLDAAGHEHHQSQWLKELLGSDPERDRVVGEMRRIARSLLDLRLGRIGVSPRAGSATELATRAASYAIRGPYLNSGTLGPADAVLVTLERLTPELPSPSGSLSAPGSRSGRPKSLCSSPRGCRTAMSRPGSA